MKPLLISVVAASAGLLACACSASGGVAAPRATVTLRSAASASSTSSPAAGSTPAGSSAAGSSAASPAAAATQASSHSVAPGCLSRYLGTKIGPGGDAGDSVYVNIDFTNLDNVPCTLYGFPGVSLGGGVPVEQIGLPSAENLATPRRLVTLQPGGIAYTQLQVVLASTYPASQCDPRPADYLDIIPPNQTVAIPTYFLTTACAKPVRQLTVDAVQLGMNP